MYLDEIKKGMSLEIPAVKINRDEMLSFSQRFNNIPIHTDEEYAKKTKFGQVIASGMMSFLVIWAEYVQQDFAGNELIAGKSSNTEWYKPVFAEDTLSAKAEVTDIIPRNDYNGIMQVTIDVFNQNGEMVLKNVTESFVKRK